MFAELAVAAAFWIVWIRINNHHLSANRRRAALVALVLNRREHEVLLEALQYQARAMPALLGK